MFTHSLQWPWISAFTEYKQKDPTTSQAGGQDELETKVRILHDYAIVWWRFSVTIDRTVDLTLQANESLSFLMIIEEFSMVYRRTRIFTWKLKLRKIMRVGENSLWSQGYNEFYGIFCVFITSQVSSFLDGCPSINSVVIGDADILNLLNCMICMLRFFHNCLNNNA